MGVGVGDGGGGMYIHSTAELEKMTEDKQSYFCSKGDLLDKLQIL